jgi:hypothetical protein
VFVAACDVAIEAAGRRANDPDDEDVRDFGLALGQQLAIWFPDTALTPFKQMIVSGAFIVGEMSIGSEKLPKKPPSIAKPQTEENPSPIGVNDAVTTEALRPTS